MGYIVTLSLLLICSHKSYSETIAGRLLTDSIDYSVSKSIIKPYYQFTHLNDLNPLLGQKSNDEGYTSGFIQKVRLLNEKKVRFYDIALTSDLYTKYQFDEAYSNDGRWTIPQKFTEINTLKFSVNQYNKRKRLFTVIEVGTGVRNKKHPIWGFSLFMQGGSDGQGGYHSLIGDHGTENLETGGIKPFFYIAPSIIKNFTTKVLKAHKDPMLVQLQTGFSIGTSQIKSSAFFRFMSELPIIQLNNTRKKISKITAICKGSLRAHASGILFCPEFGAEVSLLSLTFGYTSIFFIGKQNASVINYFDNEACMRGYLKVNL